MNPAAATTSHEPARPYAVTLAAAAARGSALAALPCRLHDGRTVLLRPARPDDARLLTAWFAHLSPESRRLRFHADVVGYLTAEQVRALTQVDHRDHAAWVATTSTAPESVVGLATYDRLPSPPHTAEAAIAVLDAWQGLGVGTALLDVLAIVAGHHDIRVLRNYVLRRNRAMLRLLDELGAERQHLDRHVDLVELEVSEAALAGLPDTSAARALRRLMSASAETVSSGRPVVGRERAPLDDWMDRRLDGGDSPGTRLPTGP
ncbi:MAG TPA: GNAT family N-acetyltransferase [Egicoccus sp.]|nr:GNAT family N-acetyltransferase [Egicoccus sp.]HSK23169.1 GNAT family N-acetyltransferase [Egicoccus sp.]